jgi:hypothetical protein
LLDADRDALRMYRTTVSPLADDPASVKRSSITAWCGHCFSEAERRSPIRSDALPAMGWMGVLQRFARAWFSAASPVRPGGTVRGSSRWHTDDGGVAQGLTTEKRR